MKEINIYKIKRNKLDRFYQFFSLIFSLCYVLFEEKIGENTFFSSWNETKNIMGYILVILTEMKFWTGMRFLCEHNLPEKKWISSDSLDVAFNAHVRLKLNAAGMDFIAVILTEI